jgi:hypothetical protein
MFLNILEDFITLVLVALLEPLLLVIGTVVVTKCCRNILVMPQILNSYLQKFLYSSHVNAALMPLKIMTVKIWLTRNLFEMFNFCYI